MEPRLFDSPFSSVGTYFDWIKSIPRTSVEDMSTQLLPGHMRLATHPNQIVREWISSSVSKVGPKLPRIFFQCINFFRVFPQPLNKQSYSLDLALDRFGKKDSEFLMKENSVRHSFGSPW